MVFGHPPVKKGPKLRWRLEAQDLEEDAQAGQAQGAQGPVQHQLAAVVGVELHVEGDQGQSSPIVCKRPCKQKNGAK